jgi:hypothetical protein
MSLILVITSCECSCQVLIVVESTDRWLVSRRRTNQVEREKNGPFDRSFLVRRRMFAGSRRRLASLILVLDRLPTRVNDRRVMAERVKNIHKRETKPPCDYRTLKRQDLRSESIVHEDSISYLYKRYIFGGWFCMFIDRSSIGCVSSSLRCFQPDRMSVF